MNLLAIDTETTGVDTHHGARPFLVSMCRESSAPYYWQAPVDPLTRIPQWTISQLKEIRQEINEAQWIIGQNIKFDYQCLLLLFRDYHLSFQAPWHKTYDTLIAGHLLCSNQKHDLTSMAIQYLGEDISKYEKALKDLVTRVRIRAKKDYPNWSLASKDNPLTPSVKGSAWGYDMWLPTAYADENNFVLNHEWRPVVVEYALHDPLTTIYLWLEMEQLLKNRQLWNIFLERMKVAKVAMDLEIPRYRKEIRGITLNGSRVRQMIKRYSSASRQLEQTCVNIAEGLQYRLIVPKSGNNQSLVQFCFGPLNLPLLRGHKISSKTGTPSLDKSTLENYETVLPSNSKQLAFIKALRKKRRIDTAVTYLKGYKKFWQPMRGWGSRGNDEAVTNDSHLGYWVLHGSANPTGTDTLRWSFTNPNTSNVCFDGLTEILTTDGWVAADKLTEDHLIAQYWNHNGTIEFITPIEVHSPQYKGDMIHIRTDKFIDMMLTPAHRCLLKHKQTGRLADYRADDFKSDYLHIHSGKYVGGNKSLSIEEVTWLAAVQADGHYGKTNGREYGIQFVFTKLRKADRLIECLDALGVKYTKRNRGKLIEFYIGKNEPVVVMAKRLMPQKEFGKWILDLDRETLDLLSSEVLFWDGYRASNRYSSSTKANADWVQILWTLSNSRSTMRSYWPSGSWAKREHHSVSARFNKPYSMTTNFTSERVPWNGPVYCVTVPSSYIVIRRNGRVSITGNSKQEDFNLRYAFGPAPGREWYSMDGQNLELRIPAYESGEPDMIYIFEHPNDPPYYGSYHLLVFDLLHPERFRQHGKNCKTIFESTWYQWTKNFNFALIYGCQEAKGDATAKVPGAYQKVRRRFPRIAALADKQLSLARKYGYVSIIPDKAIDPLRGYPLNCSRLECGAISPTVPLNYHIQGTAMWWTSAAMVLVADQIRQWQLEDGFDLFMVLQVHDEIVYDTIAISPDDLWRIATLKRMMEAVGDRIGVPTPVSVERHTISWAEGVDITAQLNRLVPAS